MALKKPPPVSVSPRGQAFARSDPDRTVVWVRGEHDMATAPLLAETMAKAVALDDADVVVDLGGVEFMDASTVGAIIRTRNLLASRSRSLVVRSPSPCARRLLDACRLAGLVEPDVFDETLNQRSVAALATWVAVPASTRYRPGADAGHAEHPGTQERVSVSAAASGSWSRSGPLLDEPRHERG